MNEHIMFPPLRNGLDYLESVIEHLRDDPDQRDLKYAVLHLQAAVEVLLKARLIREHWSLVFENPSAASHAARASGDFKSVTLEDTLTRLTNIVGVEVPKPAQQQFRRLAYKRNKLQHFGMAEQAPAIENLAGQVLDGLLCFIRDHLVPGAEPDDKDLLDRTQVLIREEMRRIKALVEARLARIEPELAARAGAVVCCPDCQRSALPIDHGDLRCRVCDRAFSPDDVASEYAETVLGLDLPRPGRYGGGDLLHPCWECGVQTLVWGAVVQADPNTRVWVCFNCGTVYSNQEIGECDMCGVPILDTDHGHSRCQACVDGIARMDF